MQIERLNYFVETYNSGSITKASQKCNVTQQTVSIAIKELENELQVTLFHRTKSGLQPTKYCQEIFPSILKIIDEWNTLMNTQKKNEQPIVDGIKVFIPSTLCPFTIDIFENFSPKFPKVNIFLKEYIPSIEHLDELFSSNADIIIHQVEKYEFENSLLIQYPEYSQSVLFMDTIVAIVNNKSPYTKYKTLPQKALTEWEWIFYNTEDCSAITAYKNIFNHSFPKTFIQTDNFNIYSNAIANHNYVGVTTNLIKKSLFYKQQGLKTIQLSQKTHFYYILAVKKSRKNKLHVQEMQNIIQKLFTP